MSIRIFVGTPANNEDLEWQAVLEYSLRARSKHVLDITWMMLSRDPASFWYSDPQKERGWRTHGWATPFTGLRWGIPHFCGFKGRAIYMDSDIIAKADIAGLYYQDMPKAVLSKRHGKRGWLPCVMLFDCEKLKDILPPIHTIRDTPGKYLHMPALIDEHTTQFSGNWNCRDGEKYENLDDPDIKMIHYTKIPTQPNHKYARERLAKAGKKHWFAGPDLEHPRQELTKLFQNTYDKAWAMGYRPDSYKLKREFGNYGRGKSDKC